MSQFPLRSISFANLLVKTHHRPLDRNTIIMDIKAMIMYFLVFCRGIFCNQSFESLLLIIFSKNYNKNLNMLVAIFSCFNILFQMLLLNYFTLFTVGVSFQKTKIVRDLSPILSAKFQKRNLSRLW